MIYLEYEPEPSEEEEEEEEDSKTENCEDVFMKRVK